LLSHKLILIQVSSRRFFASKQLIINAVGSDRLGIVSDLTRYVTDVGGNVGESQAAKLGSHFALMMLVNVPENQVVALVDQLEEIEDITASVHLVKEDAEPQFISKAGIGCKFSNFWRVLLGLGSRLSHFFFDYPQFLFS
jgi:predicted amino acid-binding ACT domain protein